MSLPIKRYRDEMFFRKAEVPQAMKIFVPTTDGERVYLWHMPKADDYEKRKGDDFSLWISEDENGMPTLVSVNNKENTWEFFLIIRMV
jgi:hypothetical protein